MTSPKETLQKAREQDGGWIEHDGGKQPIDDKVTVEIRFRGGETEVGHAKYWYWKHDQDESDVVAYRLHTPAPSSSEAKP